MFSALFSPVCRRRCALRCELLLYDRAHVGYVQQCCRSSDNEVEVGDGGFPLPVRRSRGRDKGVDGTRHEITAADARAVGNDEQRGSTNVRSTCSADAEPEVRRLRTLGPFATSSNRSRLSTCLAAESRGTARDRKSSGWIATILLLFWSLRTSSTTRRRSADPERSRCDKQRLSAAAGRRVDVSSSPEANVSADSDGRRSPTTEPRLSDAAGHGVGSSTWFIRCRSPTPSTTMPQSASAASTSAVSRPSWPLATSSKSEKCPLLPLPRSATARRSSSPDARPSPTSDSVVIQRESRPASYSVGSSCITSSSSTLARLEYGLTDDDDDDDDGLIRVSDDDESPASSTAAASNCSPVASPVASLSLVHGVTTSRKCAVAANIGTNRSIVTVRRQPLDSLPEQNNYLISLVFLYQTRILPYFHAVQAH